ncbi:serpin family protein [Proteiniclasticum sp.]|uniref:serpin family protein n=1 Tax=Proteiniclasticum sp. TaxID=2053595 RepID=UPI0025EE6B79|nr:serpin family protein [Proteiniclasticum sp.]
MKKNRMPQSIGLLLSICLVLSFAGCKKAVSAEGGNLLDDLKKETVEKSSSFTKESTMPALTFSFNLFTKNLLCENTLISPLSVLTSLGMTANGAKSDTLSQMEEVFGMDRQSLNQLLYFYTSKLPQKDKLKVHMANSIWFRDGDRFQIRPEFLQTTINYCDAGIYRSPFDDSTVKDINSWVRERTDGQIPEILNEISSDTVMYLINALSFDAEWETIYKENEVRQESFHADDGTLQNADMMYSQEQLYLEDGDAKGFIKKYADGNYAFAAILPPEDLHLSAYLSDLTPDKLREILENPIETSVQTMMPKFTTEYSVEMSDILKSMGMEHAFDEDLADLSGLGSAGGNLYINRVLHKAKIEVHERGTKAGAATAVEINEKSAAIDPPKTVFLDRPFFYIVFDTESYLPLFLGTTLYVK